MPRPINAGSVAIATVIVLASLLLLAVPRADALNGPSHALTATLGSASSHPADPYPVGNPVDVAIDQATGDIYVANPDRNEQQVVTIELPSETKSAPGATFTLTLHGETTSELAWNSESQPVRAALESLSSIGPGNVSVVDHGANEGPPFTITFVGELAHTNVAQLTATGSGLPPGSTTTVETTVNASRGDDVEKFNKNGEFLFMVGKGVDLNTGGNLCPEHNGDVCGPGQPSSSPGGFESPNYLAVDNSPAGGGDFYVGDSGDNILQKFAPTGAIVANWGVGGENDFSEVPEKGEFQNILHLQGIDVDPAGNLFALGGIDSDIWKFNQAGRLTISDSPENVRSFNPEEFSQISTDRALAIDLSDAERYRDTGSLIEHFRTQSESQPVDDFGSGQISGGLGIDLFSATHTAYVANSLEGDVLVFTDIRPQATTDPPQEVSETSITVAGHLDPKEHGEITACRFEWGLTASYGHSVPCEPNPEDPGAHFNSPTAVTGRIAGLTPIHDLPVGTKYHYRLVVSNEGGGTGEGLDQIAFTTDSPHFEGISASHLSATSAVLNASIRPGGLDTSYHFSYGPTTTYGTDTPEAEITGSVEELSGLKEIAVPIEDLQSGVVYHFRLTVKNTLGESISEDHTFSFFPPGCPNSAVRQQTGTGYLPDCRAYELVSPANANATLLFPGGPNTGQATSPPRFSYTGDFSSIPGTNTIETAGDLYVATRTDTGWVSKYIGLSGSEAACMGGPPTLATSGGVGNQANLLTDTVFADPTMSHFLNFNDGGAIPCSDHPFIASESGWQITVPSTAPYLWNSEGALQERLPSGIGSNPSELAPFNCPYISFNITHGDCSGETTASGDLSHVIFSTTGASFAENEATASPGLTTAPGSAYDDNLATGQIKLISLLPDGENIPQDPNFADVPRRELGEDEFVPGGHDEFLRFPFVSTDGSHVLISTATTPTLISKDCNEDNPCPRYTESPLHLYMTIDDTRHFIVSESQVTHENVPVSYVGATPDGSKVYFTSSQHLTGEDLEHGGASLYMWSAAKAEQGEDPLSLLSKADNPGNSGEPGNTAACEPALNLAPIGNPPHRAEKLGEVPWVAGCGILPYSDYSYTFAKGPAGGNGIADSAISDNGDIYFFSPERLAGNQGVDGQQNLYLYREGTVKFVASLPPEHSCVQRTAKQQGNVCYIYAEGPILRMEATPDDSRMAFITAARLSSYDNAGHREMYIYTPATENLLCVSCNPSGHPATGDVEASQDGRFITDDGRVFFSTTESLVPQDTNEGIDVYEFVDGRPQLITPGTGTGVAPANGAEKPGLVSVSANGSDVFFATFDSLVSEDHNGNFLKFYDARTNGGFPQPPPIQPCAAAEECHGPGTEAPQLPPQATSATLSGGNASPKAHKHSKKHKRRHKKETVSRSHKRKRAAKHKHGGAK